MTSSARDDEPRVPALLDGPALSVLVGVSFALLSLPLLATTALCGDGAEVVRTAMFGGVRHPSGFPLQAWLDRIVVLLPFGAPATRLALLGALAHAAATGFVADALRTLGARPSARVLGAIFFGAFPSVWHLAVQPEEFALGHLFFAALWWQALRLMRGGRAATDASAAMLGLVVGLAATTHPITAIAFPAFLASLAVVMRERSGRARRFLLAALPFVAVVVPLDMSLLLLRGPHTPAWPDWGRLETAGDVVRHVLRLEYGGASLASSTSGESTTTALAAVVACTPLAHAVAASLALLGVVGLARAPRTRATVVAVGSGLVVGALFLALAKLGGDGEAVRATLVRLAAPLALPVGLVVGLGLDVVGAAARRAAAIVDVLAVSGAVALVVTVMPDVDASRDRVVDVASRAIGQALPADALYVSYNDEELFAGARVGGGERMPIGAGLLGVAWYTEGTLPLVEPRLRPRSPAPAGMDSLVRAALDAGLTVAATDDVSLKRVAGSVEYRGVLALARRDGGPALSPATADAALALCPLVEELEASGRPRQSAFLWSALARAYDAAASWLEAEGSPDASLVRGIGRALQDRTDARGWREGCVLWKERMRTASTRRAF
jgi:hypothetical protein